MHPMQPIRTRCTNPRITRPCRYGDTLHTTGEQSMSGARRAARMEHTEKKALHEKNVARNAEIQARKAALVAAGLPANRAERRRVLQRPV